MRSFIREVVHRVEAWCYHPDPAMGWIRPAVNAACARVNSGRPEVVWATGGPVSSFIVAQRISSKIGIPYVLDFRDALTFTPNQFEEIRPRWARRLDQLSMSRLLRSAQSVVFRYNTEAECYFRAYGDALEPSKIHVIPNGFEGEVDEFRQKNGKKLKILYTGALTDYRYDTLLEALHSLKKSSSDLINLLHFEFVGEGTEALQAAAVKLGLTEVIKISGPVSYETTNRLTRDADALLILGRPPTKRGYELFAGAKLFGYLKAGNPIFAVLPDDETKKVLVRVGVTTIAHVESPFEIINVLRFLVEAWSQRRLSSLSPKRAACKAYSAERQAQDLVRALEGAPAQERFVPGSAEIPPSLRQEILGPNGAACEPT
jgi:glycosyltransferase involved in cell wall biosynthesis